jgi:hypothetical protein
MTQIDQFYSVYPSSKGINIRLHFSLKMAPEILAIIFI